MTTQRIIDKSGNVLKEYPADTVKGRRFILPFRLNLLPVSGFKYPDLWKHEGGRVEFETQDGKDWHEVHRRYETWFHDPFTGHTWGREAVAPDPAWTEADLTGTH